ncbi:MAG: hypothetical protein VW333_12705 [Pseudomonadales bacterium]
MRYSNKYLNNELTIKDLKKGDYLTLKNIDDPKANQVWLKDDYDKSSKSFFIVNFANMNKSKLVKGSLKIYTSFNF